jgi:hypothetical protein
MFNVCLLLHLLICGIAISGAYTNFGLQGFGEETWGKATTWETQAQMEG